MSGRGVCVPRAHAMYGVCGRVGWAWGENRTKEGTGLFRSWTLMRRGSQGVHGPERARGLPSPSRMTERTRLFRSRTLLHLGVGCTANKGCGPRPSPLGWPQEARRTRGPDGENTKCPRGTPRHAAAPPLAGGAP